MRPDLTAPSQITLNAAGGAILHSEGLVSADRLIARANSGIAAHVNVDSVDAVLRGTGDIDLDSVFGVTLASLTTADGRISVNALGAVRAENLVTQGVTEENDISIATTDFTGAGADLTIDTINAGFLGDVFFDIDGSLVQAGGAIEADELSVTARNGVNITTKVRSISLETRAVGNAVVHQQKEGTLTLSGVKVMNGSLTADHPLGSVILGDVRLLTNTDANDLTVNARDDILVAFASAGVYANNSSEVLNPAGGAESGMTSLGDVFLTAGGKIEEVTSDGSVDLVGDDLNLLAVKGINGLEIAANELKSLVTTSGSITLTESDGVAEKTEGLIATSVRAPAGSVTITSEGYLEVRKVVAKGSNGVARLASEAGNLFVIDPGTGSAIEYTKGIALSAGRVLQSYRFFQAPELIEYHAGDYFDFAPADNSSSGLPSSISSATIVLENGAGITFEGTLAASKRIELVSDSNVFFTGKIIGSAENVIIAANGFRPVEARVYEEATGGEHTVTQPSGFVNIQTGGITAGRFEFRAGKDVFVEHSGDFTIAGFIGGLSGFEPARNIALRAAGTLRVLGGIINASDSIDLEAVTVSTDATSVFIASDLQVTAESNVNLNTLVQTITAESTGAGDIVIHEGDAVTLENIVADNGRIEVTTGGDLTALHVSTITDGAGKGIELKSSADLFVNDVEAGVLAGAQKTASEITLDAAGTIKEPAGYVDNNASAERSSVVDVYAWRIHLRYGLPTPPGLPVTVMTSPNPAGAGDEIEILYTDGSQSASGEAFTQEPTTMSGTGGIPSSVQGDYILIAPNYTGDLSISVSGTLVVVALPPLPGRTVTLSAGEDLIVVSDLNVGSGTITLNAADALTAGGLLMAGTLNVTAGDDLTLTTEVNTLNFTQTGAGNDVTIYEKDSLTVNSGSLSGGDVVIEAGGTINVTGTIGQAESILLNTRSGNINAGGGNLGADSVTLSSAGSITAAIDAKQLTVTARGAIDVVEADDVTVIDITQVGGNQPLSIAAGGDLTVGPVSAIGSRVELSSPQGTTELTSQVVAGSLEVNARTLIVHVAEVEPFPTGGFIYNGTGSGSNVDTLVLRDGLAGTITHTLSSASEGQANLGGQVIDHRGVEVIRDLLSVTARIFQYADSAADDIALGDDGVLDNGISRMTSVSKTMTLDFTNPADILILNAGGGDDQVTLTPLDSRNSEGRVFEAVLVANGESGNDSIDASAMLQSVILTGGSGNDILEGGSNGDEIFGGDGGDWAIGNGGSDRIHGNRGNDVLIGDYGVITSALLETTQFDSGADDIIWGDEDDDIILGGYGQDWLSGSIGQDIILGDDGRIDHVSVDGDLSDIDEITSSSTTSGGGADIIEAGSGNDLVIGGRFGDLVTAEAGNNVVIGDSGRFLAAVSDAPQSFLSSRMTVGLITTLEPGDGAGDVIKVNTGSDIVLGGFGADEIELSDPQGDHNIAIGDNGFIDYVVDDGDPADIDRIWSTDPDMGDDDTIVSAFGDDIIIGGFGADTIRADGGDNIVIGDNGRITAAAADSSRWGGQPISLGRIETTDFDIGGVDTITTLAGRDIVVGGDAGDLITVSDLNNPGVADHNIVIGDDGFVDYAIADNDPSDIDALASTSPTLGGGEDIVETGDGDDIVIGGRFDDTIRARNGDNIVFGDSGRILAATVDSTTQPHFQRQPITLGRVETIEDTDGGADTITTLTGYDIIFGGHQGDMLRASLIDDLTAEASADSNIVLGDTGYIDYDDDLLLGASNATNPDDIDEIVSTTTIPTLGLNENLEAVLVDVGGADTIDTGDGNDIVIGGRFADTIRVRNGDNDVIGDSGRIRGSATDGVQQLAGQPLSIGRVATIEPGDGGGDVILTGSDQDIVLAGMGDDTVTTNAGYDIVLGDNGLVDYEVLDSETSHIDQISTSGPNQGGVDIISTGSENDIVLAGTSGDVVTAGSGNDLVFGDHGKVEGDVHPTQLPLNLPLNQHPFAWTSIDTQNTDDGGEDLIRGNSGEDVIIGGQGIDRITGGSEDDDIIGGHNVPGGQDEGDFIDAGSQNDVVAGDNADILRTGDSVGPRMRVLDGYAIYDSEGNAQVTGDPKANPANAVERFVVLFDHSFTPLPGTSGNDVIAGSADDDVIFGELGDDAIQGDGSTIDEDGVVTIDVRTTLASVEDLAGAGSDGDDYIEGNGGNDLIFGNLGQDDIVGGSSDLFGLNSASDRPDGSDRIFGGAGLRIERNDIGDASPEGHARDADTILGDNGEILRVVGTNGAPASPAAFATFNYDIYDTPLRLIPRALVLLNYLPGGTASDIGEADTINGESGDDTIHGMRGNDVLFGDGRDDDIYGGTEQDRIYGGSGEDGIVADDGMVLTSRNGLAEPLNRLLAASKPETLSVPGNWIGSVEFIEGRLYKTVELTAWEIGANDIVYGGLGDDFIHGGAGDDSISGAEALQDYYTSDPQTNADPLGYKPDPAARTFEWYNPLAPAQKIMIDASPGVSEEFFLNFEAFDSELKTIEDGKDYLFGDLGNDWIVGGTGHDRLFGGMGDDLLNADDNLETDGGSNLLPDASKFGDFAFGGGGLDVLVANTGLDRLVDWNGEFNTFVVPFSPFGTPTVNRSPSEHWQQFLLNLSRGAGADQSLGAPNGEIGLVTDSDPEWENQHGVPRDPQSGNNSDAERDTQGTPEDDSAKIPTAHGSTPGGHDGDEVEVTAAIRIEKSILEPFADDDGNNGIGNGLDPQPSGNPPVNDGPGASAGKPGSNGKKKNDDGTSTPALPNGLPVDADDPNDPAILEIGTEAVWIYELFNEGNLELGVTEIIDDAGTPEDGSDDFNPVYVSGDFDGDGLLDPNEIWLFTSLGVSNYTVSGSLYTNVGSVTASVPGAPVSVSDSDSNSHVGLDISADSGTITGQNAQTADQPVISVTSETASGDSANLEGTFAAASSDPVGTEVLPDPVVIDSGGSSGETGIGPATDPGIASEPSPVTATFRAGDSPKTIVDRGTTWSTLQIDDTGVILDSAVELNISHDRWSDINVFLTSTSGARIELSLENGGNGKAFSPSGDFSQFTSENLAGSWTLEIVDGKKQKTGTLNSWALVVKHS